VDSSWATHPWNPYTTSSARQYAHTKNSRNTHPTSHIAYYTYAYYTYAHYAHTDAHSWYPYKFSNWPYR
jgi:hypothetical protein